MLPCLWSNCLDETVEKMSLGSLGEGFVLVLGLHVHLIPFPELKHFATSRNGLLGHATQTV